MNIKFETTDKALSCLGGLPLFSKAFSHFGISESIKEWLPAPKIRTQTTPVDKFKAMVLGLVAGAECLDDMDRLACDSGFIAVNGRVNASNTLGDFLRASSHYQCKKLNESLIETALKLRKAVLPKKTDIIIDIDSTKHAQSGVKIEGARHYYDGTWGLDSLQAFDQFGFQYWMEVREGATFTANGAPEVIHRIFTQVPKKVRKYARADSGFCNLACFESFRMAGVGFVTAMRENMYSPLIGRVRNWKRAKGVKFKGNVNCEVGHTIYYPDGGSQTLRVVFLRALRQNEQNNALFCDAKYDYCAFVSNIGHHEMSNEKLVEFYRGRGNCENFIRELKNGFDLKHFPCLKLNANKFYGVIAAFAHNLMRWAAYLANPAKPYFAKLVRFRMVNIACQVVKHARSVSFRMNDYQRKEVCRWIETLHKQIGCA